MKYFTIGELTHSDKAMTCHIDNTPFSQTIVDNMTMLIERLLDPIREAFGEPIHVNSGYRCPALNRAVGGAQNSQHLTGQAVDITVGDKYDNMRLFNVICNRGFQFD